MCAYTSSEERLDVVEVLVSDVQLRQGLWEEHLRAMPDLARLARKLQRGKGTLQVWRCVLIVIDEVVIIAPPPPSKRTV